MLCSVCRQGLEGIWGPSRRGFIMDQDLPVPKLPSYLHDMEHDLSLEINKYVYKHHTTKASFRASQRDGCVICIGCDNQGELENDSSDENDIQVGAEDFSSFRVVYGDQYTMMYICIQYGRELGQTFSLAPVHIDQTHFYTDHTINFDLGTSTSDERTWSLIREWLSLCLESHPGCTSKKQSKTSYMPTRILEISESETSGNPLMFRLVNGVECPPGSSYMTLSYCWGIKPAEQVYRLLRETTEKGPATEKELRKRQSISVLPKTLQHAMEAAKRLGSRYLWIDRLCIIQDSDSDWRTESACMSDIYKNAMLCISTLDCSDDEGELFGIRDPDLKLPTVVNIRTEQDADPIPFFAQAERPDVSSLFLKHQNSRLLSRGWVVQERILSPRVAYFGRDQVFWECMSSQCCELRPRDLEPSEAEADRISTLWKRVIDVSGVVRSDYTDLYEQLFEDWTEIVEIYGQCDLTCPGDKLVAISGLANEMRRKITALKPEVGHRYLAGLWEETLPRSLLWSVPWVESRPSRRASEYIAPSWSWASLDGPLAMADPRAGGTCVVSLVSCKTTSDGKTNNDTGKIKSGTIVLEGPLLVAHIDMEGWERSPRDKTISYIEPAPASEISISQPSIFNDKWLSYQNENWGMSVLFDIEKEQPAKIFYLVVHKRRNSMGRHQWNGLGLVKDDQKIGLYKRVGLVLCEFESHEIVEEYMQKCPKVQITIV